MAFDLKQMILQGTKYVSGYVNKNDDYVISASMVANDPLQNYLSIIHGKPTETEINDATLGTIFHKGMEQIVAEAIEADEPLVEVIGSEVSMHTKLANDWILSGTADLITTSEMADVEVHDYKLTKNYTRKMMIKELHTHSYTKQLQVLEALLRDNMNEVGIHTINGDVKLVADFFLKDSKAINNEPTHNPLTAPNKAGTSDMNGTEILFAEVIAITDSLQAYIESGQVPPQCSDTWPRSVKGKIVHTRCALYCSHGKAGLCPYYKPSTQETVDRLTNW